jgi:hypothetical protein
VIKNVKEFKLSLENYKGQVIKDHAKLCGRIAFKLHSFVVAGSSSGPKTPVDTGWARNNWAVFIGWNCPTEPIGTRPKDGIPTTVPPFDVKGALFKIPDKPVIWVYNNVPYIEVLEDGHSSQAPTGMMQGALNQLQIEVDNL